MNLLILGGTQFLGRHLAQQALDADHQVTLFHRGRTNPHIFPAARHILGDRNGDLAGLDQSTWDAVIDTSGFTPETVVASARLLRSRAARYIFISSISVYAELSTPGLDETAPVAVLPQGAERTLSGETYGALKAECEEVVRDHFGDDALVIRPGLIVGPHDPTDRFTYWPVRMARPGPVLIPDGHAHPVQWIDVRDLAQWTLRLAESRLAGLFNATGPHAPCTLGEFLAHCHRHIAPQAQLVPVDDAFLQEQQVGAFVELPFWLPQAMRGLLQIDCSRALRAGLTFRPLADTLADTLAWRAPTLAETPLRAGLAPQREADLIALWRASRPTSSP